MRYLLTIALCFLTSCATVAIADRDEIYNINAYELLNVQRQEQDNVLQRLDFFGVLSQEEKAELRAILRFEVGHYVGSQVALAENDQERYDYHIESREEIQDLMADFLDEVQERLEQEAPTPESSVAPPRKQGL